MNDHEGQSATMQSAESVFRDLLDAAPDAIVAVDRGGQIVFASAAVERLFGWPVSELLGKQIEVLIPHDVAAQHVAHRAGFVADPQLRPMGIGLQLSGRRRDGNLFPAEISLNSIGDETDSPLFLAAVRDITDRIAAAERQQQERTQSRRLESLGQLAGGVAHDFNNLLGVILNYATLASRRATESTVRADLGEICAAAELGAGLTKQLLTFARHEQVAPEPVDVGAVVRGLASLLERTLGEHIELRLVVSDVPFASCARMQLEQILLNLAVNARDAMPAGGVLTIAVDESALLGRRAVRLTVTDTGCGMSAEVASHAFEPMFTTKPRGQGTGLGLATVYGIVQQGGGEVSIRSVPNEGTTVTALLAEADGLPAVPAVVAMHPPGGHERILVVEDERALRISTGRLLADSGYDVLYAEDGVDALDVLAREHNNVDLVVSDVTMPRMRGDELGRQVSERWPWMQLIFVTGNDSGATPLTGRTLAKPINEYELLGAIREALDA